MPFRDVGDLKASESFARSSVLKSLTDAQLARFVRVFNNAHARAVRGGATPEEAEATAFAIATASAKRSPAAPKTAALDPEVHYFAVMMPEQFEGTQNGLSAGEFDFDFVRGNIGLISSMVAGNEFNLDHDHDKPVGRISSLLLPEQVPDHARANMDPDTPFVVAAHYFVDTPAEVRKLAGVSAEWLDMPLPDGSRRVILPDTFAVSETPLNDQSSGIRKLAADKDYKLGQPEGVAGERLMPDQPKTPPAEGSPEAGELASKLAALQTEVDTYKAKAAQFEEFQTKFASLVGKKPDEELTAKDLDRKIASLKAEADKEASARKAIEAKFAALEETMLKSEAQSFAQGLLSQGKIAADKVDEYAQEYVADKDTTLKWAARLPVIHPVVGPGKSASLQISKKMADDELKFLQGAF